MSQEHTVPQLYQLVRSALSIVYGSSPHGGVTDRAHHKEAHDFLVGFQKASSRRGKQSEILLGGSTYLTCLYILGEDVSGNANIQDYERIFVAQTIVSRLRSMNSLEEAMDLEKEPQNKMHYIWNQLRQSLHAQNIQGLISIYNKNKRTDNSSYGLTSMHMFVSLALSYASEIFPSNSSIMLDLLSSAVALVTVRLKYSDDVSSLQDIPPLVEIVTQCISIMSNYVLSIPSNQTDDLKTACSKCCCSMLGAIPDEVCDSIGSTSRLSMDPRFHSLAITELRSGESGLNLFTTSIKNYLTIINNQAQLSSKLHASLLLSCEKWARTVPLTSQFLDDILPLALLYVSTDNRNWEQIDFQIYSLAKEASFCFLNAICDSASISPAELGVMLKIPNMGKRLKKQRKIAGTRESIIASDDILHNECKIMKEIVCLVAFQTLPQLTQIADHSYSSLISAFAQICLPFLLSSKFCMTVVPYIERELLLQYILNSLCLMCQSDDRDIRSLAFEPLLAICDVANDIDSSLGESLFISVSKCGLQLMSSCMYPECYFDNFTLDSDHDLEVERNNVRDVVRSLGCLSPLILRYLVSSCHNNPRVTITLSDSKETYNLPSENVMHTISALAKPLNRLTNNNDQIDEEMSSILIQALDLVGSCSKTLSAIFRRGQYHRLKKVMFPVSRLCCMAVASYSPFLSSICKISNANILPHLKQLRDCFEENFRYCVDQSLMSLRYIPEYAAQSSLGDTQYDIRGAMCGPGGEDHVGCLVLMRLVDEGESLSTYLASIDSSSFPIFNLILAILDELKRSEVNRGLNSAEHEITTPMTRRIILRSLSKLVLKKQSGEEYLASLFQSSLNILSSFSFDDVCSSEDIFRLCEEVFDLSFFGSYSSNLFSSEFLSMHKVASLALQNVIKIVKQGYQTISVHNLSDESIQWGRLRGSIYNLLRICLMDAISDVALGVIVILNQTECDALKNNWTVFHETLISEDILPAGAFLNILGESLKSIDSRLKSGQISYIEACNNGLNIAKTLDLSRSVFETVLTSTEHFYSGYVDPRPFMSEAWYGAMKYLLVTCTSLNGGIQIIQEDIIQNLLIDSCVGAIIMILSQTHSKETFNGIVSMDAPHTLIVVDFLQLVIPHIPNVLEHIGLKLRTKIAVRYASTDAKTELVTNEWLFGGSVLTASLMRGSSGGLPPWAIESIPDLFSSIFSACGSNTMNFSAIMKSTMLLTFESGTKLAGKYFERISDHSAAQFLEQAQESARRNDSEGWRRFKGAVKNICGGKKKDSGYNLKPALTSWECSRI